MKRFQFTFQRVLKLKKQFKAMIEMKVQKSSSELTAQRARIVNLENHLIAITEELQNPVQGDGLINLVTQIGPIKEQLQMERERAEQMLVLHQQNCDELSRSTREVDVLRSLEDDELAEYRAEYEKSQQAMIDEFVQFRDAAYRRTLKAELNDV